MTTELVLLLAVYALVIMALFLDKEIGVVNTFTNNLPKLSARIEKHTATGYGFWTSSHQPGQRLQWQSSQ